MGKMLKPKGKASKRKAAPVKRTRDVPLNLRVSADEKRLALALAELANEESLSAYLRKLIRAEARKAKLT